MRAHREDDERRDIAEWIRLLDASCLDDADDAIWALSEFARDGADVVARLVPAIDEMGPLGQSCALELLHGLVDQRAAPVALRLLEVSDDHEVREAAVEVLARLDRRDSVVALRRAYRASRARGESPVADEPTTLRRALTALGARHPVVPPEVAAAVLDPEAPLYPEFRFEDLPAVLEGLASAEQVVLTVLALRRRRRADGRVESRGVGSCYLGPPELDVDIRIWTDLVHDSHLGALSYLYAVEARCRHLPGTMVTAWVDWISEADVRMDLRLEGC